MSRTSQIGRWAPDVVSKVDSIASLPPATGSGRKVSVTGYHAGTTVGGGEMVDAGLARHNGGTFIDPNRISEFGTAAYYVDSGSDANCWKRDSEYVSVEQFGAQGNGVSNDTIEVQAAVDYCLSFLTPQANGQSLVPVLHVNSMCRLTESVIIDHPENSSGFFRIVGDGVVGGFLCNAGINMFDTTYTGNDRSQQISFEQITFATTVSTSYVMAYRYFARCNFTECFFNKIRLLKTTADFVVTLRLDMCYARNVQGRFIEANECYDVHADNCLFEVVTGDVIYSTLGFNGCSITNTIMQSCQAKGIHSPGSAQGLAITGCYSESLIEEFVNIGTAAGMTYEGNYVNTRQSNPDNRIDTDFFEVVIGDSQGFLGGGNKFSTRGYKFTGAGPMIATVGAGDDFGVQLVRESDQSKLVDVTHGTHTVNGFNESGIGAGITIVNTGSSLGTEAAFKFQHGTSIKNEILSTIFGGSGFGRFTFKGRGGAGGGQTYATLDYEALALAAGTDIMLGTVTIASGTGSPEGSVAAVVGSLYLRTDGGGGSTFYVKESGAGNTGWTGK